MDSERLKQIEEIYHAALGIAPAEREAFFKTACIEDADLRHEVESLLACEIGCGDFLDALPQTLAAEVFSEHEKRTNLTGRKISHYKIKQLLGKGGMGEVYLAEDIKLDRKAALKILPPALAADKERMSRFVREAKSASSLNHPNILTIYEINEFEGIHFIATEFIDGKTLNYYVKDNPLNFKSVLEIAIQIASALNEAHSAGIVHRDIKPDNVMIRPNGLVKILDFGIAKLFGSGNQPMFDREAETVNKSVTGQGVIIGTANYMSPEQACGKAVDARSDIFSFGVVLYEMLSGDLPFEGGTAMETIGAILHKEPKPLNSDVPLKIEKIIGKCLRKERDKRYQTIKNVCDDLKDAKRELDFQRLERTDAPDRTEPKTQILQATTADEFNQTTTNQTVSNNLPANYLLIGLFGLIVLFGSFFAYRSLTATKQIESIAVLPFTSESGNADIEYLSDGMTETLIKSLSNLSNLNVKPRSSVFRYKGKDTDLRTIAGELEVQAILNGHVVERGDGLMLSLELIDVQRNSVIWTEQYNRNTSELVSLQSDIARDVLSELETKLSKTDLQKATKSYTNNNEAYQLYLKGRFYWNQRTGENLKKAIEEFGAAVKLDPNYALAYVGLADSYSLLEQYTGALPSETLPQAKAYAELAVQIDEQLAEAHTSLGFVFYSLWKWDEAEKEFKRAIELNPKYPTARHWYYIYLREVGRYDEALAEIKRAQELDPMSLVINVSLTRAYLLTGDVNSFIEQSKRIMELHPNYAPNYSYLGLAYVKQERHAEAIAEARKAVELERSGLTLSVLGYINAVSGKQSEAKAILKELEERHARRAALGREVAAVYAGLGENDQAFAWLERDLNVRSGELAAMTAMPVYDSLRKDRRYADLLRRMNLPERILKKEFK
jgi:serine/threonine protein kinase/Flp pilus assembly protein TadD